MRFYRTGLLCVVVCALAGRARAQYDQPVEALIINASKAYTWVQGQTKIVQFDGPVTVDADKNHMTAQQAVMWISPVKRAALDQDQVELALIGDASLSQPNGITRSGSRLFVEMRVRGVIRMSAPRVGGDQSDTDLYKYASAMRPMELKPGEPGSQWSVEEGGPPTSQPTSRPTVRLVSPVRIEAQAFSTQLSPDDHVVAIFPGKINILQENDKGDVLELRADRAVIFTPFRSLLSLPAGPGAMHSIEQAVTGVYLEGDVVINRQPGPNSPGGEQRLTANRLFYDFTTDRAVLTDAVLYTNDPRLNIPIIVRASTLRQLSSTEKIQEYTAEKTTLTTSSFRTPSYAIGASSAYIRQTSIPSTFSGSETSFVAQDATFRAMGIPVFWLPSVSGTVPERDALRNIRISNTTTFGFEAGTEWGLFESMGRMPPRDLDMSYRLDYYSKRGPAIGLDGKYQGGLIDEKTLEPWAFSGDFTSYALWDSGMDRLGSQREDVDPQQQQRGRFYWRHQHFFPGDWQVQVTGGYISDPTFLEQWYNRTFRDADPQQTSLYLKRQRDSEAITFLTSFQPSDFATVAELYQEQFEVEKLPEIGYRRVGDSLMDDNLTFFSENTLAGLRFHTSRAVLSSPDQSETNLGFLPNISPGLPSLGTPFDLGHKTPQDAVTEDVTYRGDFRQEIDWPFSFGKFRVSPYVLGRYTEYTQSYNPANQSFTGSKERLYAGAGLRTTTSFWKVDDSVQSDLFDLHRLRHVVEPELNLFASTMSANRGDFLVYEEPIDAIADVTAMQWALHQRWQTKRGGPGNWRSVDFFTLNLEWNYYFNQPPADQLQPSDFRGLYFVSRPEESIARNSVNADWSWLVSDAVTLTGDAEVNTDAGDLAYATIGAWVRQDPRLSYYLALRHIGINIDKTTNAQGQQVDYLVNGNHFVFENQDLVMLGIDYQLSAKYRLFTATSYDLAQARSVRSSITLLRRFDRFMVAVGIQVDEYDSSQNTFYFNLLPEGFQPEAEAIASQGYWMQ